jgi:hypothetical protein
MLVFIIGCEKAITSKELNIFLLTGKKGKGIAGRWKQP